MAESTKEIDEALQHASRTKQNIDSDRRDKVDHYIDELLDARLAAAGTGIQRRPSQCQ